MLETVRLPDSSPLHAQNPLPQPGGSKNSKNVYERIKAMATTFRLRPGEKVNEAELAKRLGLSRTPVREALSRIAADGFLVATANRGYTVRALDAQRVFELYEFRTTVEMGVLRLVCERASDQSLADLAKFTEQSRDEPATDGQAIRLLANDEQFHERLATLTGNEEFIRSVRSINDRIRFARWMDLRVRRSLTRNDHPEIVHLLMKRDLAAAQALMGTHIESSFEELVALTKASFAEIYTGNALADYAELRFLESDMPPPGATV